MQAQHPPWKIKDTQKPPGKELMGNKVKEDETLSMLSSGKVISLGIHFKVI